MGNAHFLNVLAALKVDVATGQDSLSSPGKKSCLSSTISKSMFKDVDSFFEDIARHCKTPLKITDLNLIKEFKYSDNGPYDSECKVTLHGHRLKEAKRQEDDKDKVAAWARTHVDPDQRTINVAQFDENDSLTMIFVVMFHYSEQDETLRLEFWMDMPDGSRDASAGIATFVRENYLKPHILIRTYIKTFEVVCMEPDPLKPDRKICLTSDLSQFFDGPEALLEAYVTGLKQECIELKGSLEYGDADEVVLTADLTIPIAEGGEMAPETIQKQLRVDMAKQHLTVKVCRVASDKTAEHTATEHYQVYTEPLRFGCYIHRPAAANAGIDLELGTHYDSLQFIYHLNAVIQEREAGAAVEGLDDKDFFF